jgi:hypothetical protein
MISHPTTKADRPLRTQKRRSKQNHCNSLADTRDDCQHRHVRALLKHKLVENRRQMTKPLDQFWVLTDEQAGKRVGFVSVAYSRTHNMADGESFIAISPAFRTADEIKAHMRLMIADLDGALASVDAAFADRPPAG